MTRHGLSHGLAVLTCSISSSILVKITHDFYPQWITRLETIAGNLATAVQLDMSVNSAAALLLATLFAFFWGMAFTCLHSDL